MELVALVVMVDTVNLAALVVQAALAVLVCWEMLAVQVVLVVTVVMELSQVLAELVVLARMVIQKSNTVLQRKQYSVLLALVVTEALRVLLVLQHPPMMDLRMDLDEVVMVERVAPV